MDFCSDCGSTISDGDSFCGNCGSDARHAHAARDLAHFPPDTGSSIFFERIPLEVLGNPEHYQPPHACMALVAVDGSLKRVIRSGDESAGGKFGLPFIQQIKNFLARLTKTSIKNQTVYLVSDFAGLPVISVNKYLPTPGTQGRKVTFSFWLGGSEEEDAAIGTFLRILPEGTQKVTLEEFRTRCQNILEEALETISLTDLSSSASARAEFDQSLLRRAGISSSTFFSEAQATSSVFLDVSVRASDPKCASCTSQLSFNDEFCSACGARVPAINTQVDASESLLSSDGKKIGLRTMLKFKVTANQTKIDTSTAHRLVYEGARDLVGSLPSSSFSDPETLSTLSAELSDRLIGSLGEDIVELKIVDASLADDIWLLDAESKIAGQALRLRSAINALQLNESELELDQATQEITIRRAVIESTNRVSRSELTAEENIRMAKIELASRIDSLSRDSKLSEAEKNSELKALQRELELLEVQAATDGKRADLASELGLKQLEQETRLESKRADFVDERKQRGIDQELGNQDKKHESDIRKRRSELELTTEQANLEQERTLKKLRDMGEIEAAMAKQDSDAKLALAAQEASLERLRTQTMSSMTPEQILAIQATELAKQADDPNAVSAITQAIAESQASQSLAVAEKQAQAKMQLEREEASKQILEQNQKSLDAIQHTAVTAMESMAKVASGAKVIGSKKGGSEEQNQKASKATETPVCIDASCGYAAAQSFKFCPKCGVGQ